MTDEEIEQETTKAYHQIPAAFAVSPGLRPFFIELLLRIAALEHAVKKLNGDE